MSNNKYDIDGLIAYFEMAVKVMGFTNPEENSYEFHAAKMLKQLREERDEARRAACKGEAIIRLQRNRAHRESEEVLLVAKEISVERGWDCFKENP